MKKNLYLKFSLLAVSLVCMIAACTKMDYTYKKFLKDGDIIYPGKADSVQIFPGHNRVKLSWLLTSDPSIVRCRVYWNNGADSVEVPVNRGHGVDTISVIIDSLKEGYYNFQIYTYDKDGNTSVATDTIGQVYGDVYASSLHTRVIKKAYWNADSAFVFWYKPNKGAVVTEINYTDKNGDEQQVKITASDTASVLPGFKLHDAFQYRTGYLPDSLSIDTFYTAFEQKTIDDTLQVLLPPFPSPDGEYAIINKNSGMALTIDGDIDDNGTNVNQSTFTGATEQLWKFVEAPTEDYYAIENVESERGLAVAGASGDDGANILLWDFNSGSNDQWKLEQVEGPYYKIMVLKNGKVIEIADGSTDEGGNAQQNTWNGGDNQQFKLIWNLALNADIEGSSGGSHPAEDMFDNDVDTYWQPHSGDRKDDKMIWVQMDLGTARVFNELDQYWTHGHQHISTYKVLYSDDGNVWKTAYDAKGSGVDEGENETVFPPVKGRYVKLELNFSDDGNVNIGEIKVYYTPK